jgi:hypothetical protein
MANEFLPGVDITLQDGGLILSDDASTESILVFAPSLADDAPDEPKLVRSTSDLIGFGFGDFYVNGKINPIAAEWKASQDGGNRRTYLSAIKGVSAKQQFINMQTLLFDVLADFSVDHIVAKGVFADVEVAGLTDADYVGTMFEGTGSALTAPGVRLYSNIVTGSSAVTNMNITVGTNDVLVLTISGTDKTVTLAPANYDGVTKTVEDLIAELNVELAKITPAKVKAILEPSGSVSILSDLAFTLKSGTAAQGLGLTAQVGKAATYQVHLQGQVPQGNFALMLGQYAETQTLNAESTLAYIGVVSPVDITMRGVKTHVDALVAKNNTFSPYVSVVADEVGITIPVTNATYWTNGATHYAALVSTLRPESAPTNKALKGVKAIRYSYSQRQLNQLTGSQYVTFKLKDGNLLIVDGKTTAPKIPYGDTVIDSNYVQLSTLRITQTAIDVVRAASEPFIGEPNQMPQYNALNAAIKAALEGMRSAGALQDYKFTIQATSAKLDAAEVALSIVPMFELRKISVNVTLRPPVL